MGTFVVHPEESGPFAPVIIYMDVWGLRTELCDIARKVAVVGYYVLLPDLYYRRGRIRHEWRRLRRWSLTAPHCSTSSAAASRYATERWARSATVWAVSSSSAPPQLIPSVSSPTRACTGPNSNEFVRWSAKTQNLQRCSRICPGDSHTANTVTRYCAIGFSRDWGINCNERATFNKRLLASHREATIR